MDDLRGGDDGLDGEIGPIHILHHTLAHLLRGAGALPDPHFLQCAVLPVHRLIKRRDIDPRDLGGLLKELLLGPALLPGLAVELDVLQGDLLALAHHEQVNEGGQGLRIIGAGPPRHDQRGQLRPVGGAQGQPRQIQHIQHIAVRHLIAQGKADDVEVGNGVAALQTVEQQPLPAHLVLHVPPGGIAALAPEAVHLVHQAVQDPAAQVGHTDLIGVRKAQGISGVHRPPILYNGVIFSPRVAGRLLHLRQDMLQCPIHVAPPVLSA